MSITTNNPEALSWKYSSRGGISTRGGVITELPEDIKLTQADVDAIEVEHEKATGYIAKRVAEYPSATDQLDMIYKDITSWQATIKAIKDKYPK